MVHLGCQYVWASGECGKCGADIGLVVDNEPGIEEVDVRCGTCRQYTVVRDFDPLSEVVAG